MDNASFSRLESCWRRSQRGSHCSYSTVCKLAGSRCVRRAARIQREACKTQKVVPCPTQSTCKVLVVHSTCRMMRSVRGCTPPYIGPPMRLRFRIIPAFQECLLKACESEDRRSRSADEHGPIAACSSVQASVSASLMPGTREPGTARVSVLMTSVSSFCPYCLSAVSTCIPRARHRQLLPCRLTPFSSPKESLPLLGNGARTFPHCRSNHVFLANGGSAFAVAIKKLKHIPTLFS